jgi:hypothetical protein
MVRSICQFYLGVQAMGKMFAIHQRPYCNALPVAKYSKTGDSDEFGVINGVDNVNIVSNELGRYISPICISHRSFGRIFATLPTMRLCGS